MSLRFDYRRSFACFVAVLLSVGLAHVDASAQLTDVSIPFAPQGAGLGDANGTPAPLSATALVVPATGPDGIAQTDDDVTLLVTNIGGAAVVTPLETPFLLADGGASRAVRLSKTRALIASAGPDGDEETADDVVYLLDGLGTTNVVTPLTVGFLGTRTTWNPVRLSDDAAAVVSGLTEIALLTGLGVTNTITPLPAPDLRSRAGQPVSLGPTALLVPAGAESASDEVYLFTDLGGANTRTDLATPFLSSFRPGTPEPLDAARAMVVGVGSDTLPGTSDDGVHLLSGLDTATPSATFIPIGALAERGAGGATMLNPDLVVLTALGADMTPTTADDLIVFLSDIGGANTLRGVLMAGLPSDRAGRPVRLGPTSFALVRTGDDLAFGTSDDAAVVVTNVGSLNGKHEYALGGLGAGATTQISVISETAIMVANGGPDAELAAGGDDVVTVITGIPRVPLVRSISLIGDFDAPADLHGRPQLLGTNRAVFLSGGADAAQGSGDDDLIRIVAGIRPLPHFQCYDTRRAPFTKVGVGLEDALTLGAGDLKRQRRLCTPTNKRREEPGIEADPRHFVGYQLTKFRPRLGRVRDVEVTNQFGAATVELLRPELLLVPSAKSLTDPATPLASEIDHYKCYRVRGARARVRDLLVEDQFGSALVDVKRPFRLCTPVDKNGEGLFDAAQHLMCYEIRAPRLAPPTVFVDNQFGIGPLTPKRARELCVPSLVMLP